MRLLNNLVHAQQAHSNWFPFSREPDRKQIFVKAEMKQLPRKYQQNRFCERNKRRPWFGCRIPIDRPIDQLTLQVIFPFPSCRRQRVPPLSPTPSPCPGDCHSWDWDSGLWLGFLCRRHGTAQHSSRGLDGHAARGDKFVNVRWRASVKQGCAVVVSLPEKTTKSLHYVGVCVTAHKDQL
jgi:hypothetical protein